MNCVQCGTKLFGAIGIGLFPALPEGFICYECNKKETPMDIDQPIPYELNTKTKHDIYDVLKNPNDKLIAVDLDGTLCEGEVWNDEYPTPIQPMIDKMKEWHMAGAHLVIYTARRPSMYAQTLGWLVAHEVPFHGICMAFKPGADCYIDDKCFRPEEVL